MSRLDPRIEIDVEGEELTIRIRDVPQNWSYRHDYGTLEITLPVKRPDDA